MVHFPPLPSTAYEFSHGYFGMTRSGFPHSEIPGSKLVCSSPGLIAAYRVLHRLLAPRHSPYALSSLTTSVFEFTFDGRNRRTSTRPFSHTALPSGNVLEDAPLDLCSKRTTVCRIFWCQRAARPRPKGRQRSLTFIVPPPERACPAPPKPARRVGSSGSRLVENTGLEPVTSWLQTRRSPS